jgi:hypothetical protein
VTVVAVAAVHGESNGIALGAPQRTLSAEFMVHLDFRKSVILVPGGRPPSRNKNVLRSALRRRLGMKLIGDGLTGSWERRGSDSALLRRRRCEYTRRSKFKSEDHGRRRATVHLENSQIAAGMAMVSEARRAIWLASFADDVLCECISSRAWQLSIKEASIY